jgi:tubulysin polyketide synthase-like protein
MSTIDLLEDLRELGFKVTTNGSEIHYRGTTDPMGPELLKALKRHKQEIIEVLASRGQDFEQKLSKSGLSQKWQDYLLERVEILIDHESYSPEDAQAEVIKMIPYYRGLN